MGIKKSITGLVVGTTIFVGGMAMTNHYSGESTELRSDSTYIRSAELENQLQTPVIESDLYKNASISAGDEQNRLWIAKNEYHALAPEVVLINKRMEKYDNWTTASTFGGLLGGMFAALCWADIFSSRRREEGYTSEEPQSG